MSTTVNALKVEALAEAAKAASKQAGQTVSEANRAADAAYKPGRNTVQVPTWAALKTAYKAAESSGVKARFKAYDAIVRAYALTSETDTDSKSGAVSARSESSRSREVIDALGVESGNVFGLSAMRVAQVVKVYTAIAATGADPFSDAGRSVFSKFDQIRKFDADALSKAVTAVVAAPEETDGDVLGKADVLAEALSAAKETAKTRAAANKAKKAASEGTTVAVKSLGDVTAFAAGVLPLVREASATASDDEKAALRHALESLLAHV
jgi:hypothetical protein